jgi:hypothetical protein
MQIWAASQPPGHAPPFANKADLYDTIDSTVVGDIPWQSFTISYTGEMGEGEIAPWKSAKYDVWYRDPRAVLKSQLANRDFANEMDTAPKVVHDAKTGKRRFGDFMSGAWPSRQAVCPVFEIMSCTHG